MFGGRSSIQLARILGIRVGVDISWFVVLFLFIFWLNGSFSDVLDDDTLGFVAAVLAGIHLARTRRGDEGAQRKLAAGVLVVGLIPLVLTALFVALLIALCSGGGCS